MDAVISDRASWLSCHTTVRAMPMLSLEPEEKNRAYTIVEAIDEAATASRKLKINTMMPFFDFYWQGVTCQSSPLSEPLDEVLAFSVFLEMNQIGRARMMS